MRDFFPDSMPLIEGEPTNSSHSETHTRLWFALRLSHLPLNALGFLAHAPAAIVVSEKQRVICASHQAHAARITHNMDITTAQLLSNCAVHQRDRAREQQTITQLAERLYQFTPYIENYLCSTHPEGGLLLELSRCLALFSGVVALTTRIINELQKMSLDVEFGLAHTAKGAWLLSYDEKSAAITGRENSHIFCERLKSVPVQYLYDYPEIVTALEQTGFDTLGDLALQIDAQSISSIKKRFGQKFAATLCDIFSIEQNFQQSSLFEKPVQVYQPTEIFHEQVQFDYPIDQIDQLHWYIETMLQKLSEYLRKRQLECQDIEWTLADIYRRHERVLINCDSAQSHWQLLYDLTLIQLEHQQLPFAVDTLELTCPRATPLQNRNQTLAFDHQRQRDHRARDFAITAAKLNARLGEGAIFKLSYCDSHIPETSNARISIKTASNQQLPELHRIALRPAWLFDEPIVIEERSQGLYWRGYLTLLVGPERIQGNWWHTPTARDYFLAQRHDQVRLWIFLDLHKQCWYAQGVFA